MFWYGLLQAFVQEHGHCNVPARWKENPQLATWTGNQRALQNRGDLSAERKTQFDALGFIWDPRDAAWEAMLSELKRYRDEHGHCNVPRGWKENPQLATWTVAQRTLQNEGDLSTERKTRLNALGFVWDPQDATWEVMFGELERYRDQHGHCNVSQGWDENRRLGAWVSHQRVRKKREIISTKQEARLDAIGFVWERSTDVAWGAMFSKLTRFKDKHGHCNVPRKENPKLASWVNTQRVFKNKGKLSSAHETQLDELSFVWDPFDTAWEVMFAELKRHRERFGHCNVPHGWSENPKLGSWVLKQRQRCRKLPQGRKARLDELGFEWSRKSES